MKSRNKIIIILSIVLIFLSIIILIVGFSLAGNDIIAWFGSKWAIWFYTLLAVYVIVVVGILIAERIKRL